jgi:hypothetical protein
MELTAKVGNGRRHDASPVPGCGWCDCRLGRDPYIAAAIGLVDSCLVVGTRRNRSRHGLVTEPLHGAFAAHVDVASAQFGLSRQGPIACGYSASIGQR